MTRRKPPWERRLLAGLLCLTTGLGVLIVVLFGIGYLGEVEHFDTPDLPLYVAGALLTVPAIVAGALATRSAFRYTAGREERGKRVTWLFVAAWLLWFAWGVPTTSAFFSAALVLYTALVLPVVGLVLLISWLARRGRS